MSAEEVARAHYEGRHRLTTAAGDLATEAWAQVDPANLASSWARVAPRLTIGIAGAQLAAARMADDYAGIVLDEQQLPPDASAAVVPDALAGVASDGRPLTSLLLNPIFTTMAAIGDGAAIDRAMASGYANLDMIARTQVADAGRAADQVSLAAHKGATGYTRHLSPPSCSRCALLAGRFYRWNAGFKRHPRCDCIHVPGAGDDSLKTNPRAYFDSLSPAEQDKAFTKAGAAAIREGADIGRVVNADRGMYTAGGKHFTTEATTRAGVGRRARLMPDQIFAEAKGDRAEALRLLERHGYIRPTAPRLPRVRIMEPVPEVRIAPPPVPKTFDQRAAKAASGQRAVDAPTFGLDRKPRPEGFTDQMHDAVNWYLGSGFHGVNRYLRGQRIPHGHLAKDVHRNIAGIDAAMAASKLDRDILTFRGVLDSSPMFGSRLDGDLTGMEWREKAFVSTTADKELTTLFAVGARGSQKPMLLRILTPAGTPAVEISNMRIEAEVLLGRGLRLRVLADRGVDPDGIRHIDAEVLRD